MIKLAVFFTFFCVFASSQPASDKLCATSLNRLWLDVVFIVDNSKASNATASLEVINSLFPSDVQIGTAYEDPRSTRVAVILSGNDAVVATDLDTVQSRDALSAEIKRIEQTPTYNAPGQSMFKALNLSQHMLDNTKGFRDNYKKLIVIFTNNFLTEGDYFQPAGDLMRSGVTIASVNMGNSGLNSYLKPISSPGMIFDWFARDLTKSLENAMLTVNCFCNGSAVQFVGGSSSSPQSHAVCLSPMSSSFDRQSWHGARDACHRNGQYLATEFTQEKRAFNMQIMNQLDTVNAYFNGLHQDNGSWVWDQPEGKPAVPLDPSSGSVSSRSGCIADMKYTDGSVSWTPISCSSSFPYICESSACDTDNYCDY